MKKMPNLTHERLTELLDYDPATGVFVWKFARQGVVAGSIAGSITKGYRYIRIDGGDFLAQRLAWFYVNGVWPTILRFNDGDTKNCAIGNLNEGFSLNRKYDHKNREERLAYQREYRATIPDQIRGGHLKKKFGIDLGQYQEMFVAQKGVCAICEQKETRTRNGKVKWLAVDHDHVTGANRELLCTDCNVMIGHAKEDINTLIRAIAYLRKHKSEDNVVSIGISKEGAA